MVMDVLVVGIFIAAIFFSMHRGLVLTVVNFGKCFLAGFLAFNYCDDVKAYLMDQTSVGSWLTAKIQDSINGSVASVWEDNAVYSILPDLFNFQQGGYTVAVDDVSGKLTETILGIVAFLIIIIGVMIAASIIIRLFSKKHQDGFVGFLDRLLGLLLGIIMGAFYVFVFLALVIPVTGVFAPDLSQDLLLSLEESYFAGELYNNNILLVIFRDFIQ